MESAGKKLETGGTLQQNFWKQSKKLGEDITGAGCRSGRIVQMKPCLEALAQEGLWEEDEAGLEMVQSWTDGPLPTLHVLNLF